MRPWARVGKATLLSETPVPYGFCGFAGPRVGWMLSKCEINLAYLRPARGPSYRAICGEARSVRPWNEVYSSSGLLGVEGCLRLKLVQRDQLSHIGWGPVKWS